MLKTLFTGSPKWQSSNADERLTAVAELAPDNPALQTLALSDPDLRVRIAACARLTQVETLKTLVTDSETNVRNAAAQQWAALLGDTPLDTNLPLAVVAAALRDDSPSKHKAVAAQIAAAHLPDWLASAAPFSSKIDAINAATDISVLDALYLYWRDHDKRLGKTAHERVAALQAVDKNAQEADVLLAQMQTWSEAEEVPLSKLVETQRAWGQLTVDDAHAARFNQLLADLQRKMQNESTVRRLHEALAMQVASLALKSKKAAELDNAALNTLAQEATEAQRSPVLDAGLAQQLQQVHAAIASEQQLRERNSVGEALLATKPAKPAVTALTAVEIKTTPSKTSAPAEAVSDTLAETVSESVVTTEVSAEPIAAAVAAVTDVSTNVSVTTVTPSTEQSTYEAAYSEWKNKWRAWITSVDATTREHFEQRLAKLEHPDKVRAERPAIAHASDAEIAAANEALAKLAELIAVGNVRDSRFTATTLIKQFTAKRYGKLEEQQLNELDGEVKRLESWLKWSDGQARDALMARVEALKASPLPPDALAKEIRTIQDEWKALDKKNGGAPKPKWDRFNALCKEAYAPAKVHFDLLRKQRNENATGREKTIEALHTLADEASAPVAEGQSHDWISIEKRKSTLFDEWKKGGGVANATWKALDDKFDAALKKLDTILDAARAPEISRRKRLIFEAEALSQATPSREITEKAIAIQRRWATERPTNLPHLRRKDEQKLWDEFKKHTDAIFKARDEQRNQLKTQFSEATKARFAVIDEIKTLVNLDEAKAIESAITAARSKWRDLPLVEHEKARDLDRKFDDALIAAKRRATILSRGSVVEAMKATLSNIASTDSGDPTAAALVIDAELIAGLDSPTEITTARRMQQLRWLSERRQLPTAPDAKITALRTLLGAINATSAKITLGERERLIRAIETIAAT